MIRFKKRMEELCFSSKQGTMLRNFSLLQLEDNVLLLFFFKILILFHKWPSTMIQCIFFCLKSANLCLRSITQKFLKQISAAFDFKGYNICIEISGFWYGYLPL